MKKDVGKSSNLTELRRRADEKLKEMGDADRPSVPEQDLLKLIHELQVYQIECELQNEKLLQSERNLENTLELYSDLYDFAPVGYFTLTSDGNIRQVNLSGAALLGANRAQLIGGRFGLFVTPDTLAEFNALLKKAIGAQRKASCHVTLQTEANDPVFVRIEAAAAGAGKEFRLVVIDITESKHAEDEMRREREFNRALLENMLDGVVVCDTEGQLVIFNRAAREWHGLDPMKMPQTEWARHYDLFLEDGVTPMDERTVPLVRAFGGEYLLNAEMVIRAKGQSPRHIISNCAPFFDKDGKQLGAVGVMHDVTQRKLIERALEENEEHFRILHDTMLQGAVYQDADGQIISMNQAAIQILGKTPEEFLGQTSTSVEHDTIREDGTPFPGLDHPTMVAMRTGHEVRNVVMGVYNPREDQRRWINISAVPLFRKGESKPYQVYSIFDDITNRKRAEQEIRASEQRYRSLFENMLGGYAYCQMIYVDDKPEDLVYIAVNDEFEKITGLSDVVGKRVTEVMPGHRESAPELFEIYGRVASTGQPEKFEIYIETLRLWLSISVYCPETGYFVAVFDDITDRKLAEQQLVLLNAELEQRVADRTTQLQASNSELEAFCYSVSHDLRTPLRAIDGFSLAVMEEYGGLLDAEGQNYLRRVRAAAERMSGLIDDLLKLSRVSRDEMHRLKVSLSDLANAAIESLKEAEPERLVSISVEPGMMVKGDEHLLNLMLDNLLGNAWKFTGKQPQASIEFGVTKSEGELVYYVRDNGAGFDMAYANKLFGAFQRLHGTDEFPGTGIGLATVQRIINRHGGRIWAESEVGKGTTFYFTLHNG